MKNLEPRAGSKSRHRKDIGRYRGLAGVAPVLVAAVLTLGVAGCAPQRQWPGPRTVAPRLDADAFITSDGTRLPLRVWPAHGRARAVIVAVHGFNDYSRAFEAPARWWADRGITVYAYDQRGFGATAKPGLWGGTDLLVGDLQAVIGAVARAHPSLPLFVLGHSMGGAVAIAALAGVASPESPVKGVILAAPAVWGGSALNPFYRLGLWLAAHIASSRKLTGEGLDITPSDNIAMLRALGRDPLVIKETRIDALYGLVHLMGVAHGLRRALRVPVLLLYGERDEVIPREPVDALALVLPARSQYVRYGAGYHMLLRDVQGRTVWRDILAWVDRQAGAGQTVTAQPGFAPTEDEARLRRTCK